LLALFFGSQFDHLLAMTMTMTCQMRVENEQLLLAYDEEASFVIAARIRQFLGL
jgi:hypothetical protein